MLETLDLDLKLAKAAGRKAIERAGIELSLLQRAARENRIPVVLVFEGWDAAGKGDSIAALVEQYRGPFRNSFEGQDTLRFSFFLSPPHKSCQSRL